MKKADLNKGSTSKKVRSKNIDDKGISNSDKRTLKKMQYEFISSTSHQLRTPIASIQSSLEVLELYIKRNNTARQLQAINKIKKSFVGLKNTLERITTLYKHEVIKQKLIITKIEPHKFFNDLLDEVLIDSESGHFVNVNIDEQVMVFFADEFVMKQIIINLLNNAIKFSPDGGQIQLSVIINKKYLEIYIKDEGIGIDKKDLIKLYQPFFRGRNAAAIQGEGLGLAIVKKLCDLHKIKIECTSEQNRGTEFKLIIPQKNNYEKDTFNRRQSRISR